MPVFRTTYNILKTPWEEELFESKWMNDHTPHIPPTYDWDYQREIRIEDVDIWEEIYYQSGGIGLYAAWCPYAEFYMITGQWVVDNPSRLETFYGPGAMKRAYEKAVKLGMPVNINKVWVEDTDLWLYKEPPPDYNKKTIILPEDFK